MIFDAIIWVPLQMLGMMAAKKLTLTIEFGGTKERAEVKGTGTPRVEEVTTKTGTKKYVVRNSSTLYIGLNTIGSKTTAFDILDTLSHEMGHAYLGGIADVDGGPWFSNPDDPADVVDRQTGKLLNEAENITLADEFFSNRVWNRIRQEAIEKGGKCAAFCNLLNRRSYSRGGKVFYMPEYMKTLTPAELNRVDYVYTK